MSNRKNSCGLDYKQRYKIRLEQICLGNVEPKTAREWAIWNEHSRETHAKRIAALHAQAAIHRKSKNAGRIVVIPPGAS
jgi:hypothetical protein